MPGIMLKWSLCILAAVCINTTAGDSSCSYSGFDLSALSSFSPWLSKDGNTTYSLDVCGTKQTATGSCPADTTVCSQSSGKTVVMGTKQHMNSSTESDEAALLLFFWGEQCQEMAGEKMVSIIYFKCGKSLGSPIFLGSHSCAAYFEWRSHVVCKDLKTPVKEVPCYVYSGKDKYDLSPLMKKTGGYSVPASDGIEFSINVCRDIAVNATDTGPHCGEGVASCRVSTGASGTKVAADMGQPVSALQKTADGHLQLRYSSSSVPAGCVGNSSTTITFICPARGGSKDPVVVSDMLCDNVIEWQTEYACPETRLKSSTCQLTQESHDIDIDLSPLKGRNYQVNSGEYQYALRICEDLTVSCNGSGTSKNHVAACQMKPQDDDYSRDMGHGNHMELRYADGDLVLTYRGGSRCHTGFARETIITFQCKQDAAKDGRGAPVFREEDSCTYFFDWETKYACLDHPLQTLCGVSTGKQRFDLSALTRESGSNWVALTDQEGSEEVQYFINVCHDTLPSGDAVNCPRDSSICSKDSHGQPKSLGKYTSKSNPVYNPSTKSLQINYFGGSSCEDGGKINSTITFQCRPGNLESAPMLAAAPPRGWQCHYQFTWNTAAACPLSRKTGSNCRVSDNDAGYVFDLSPLTRAADKPYKVSNDQYDFYLNVCGAVSGTACDSGHSNAAVCQVSKSDSGSVFKLGEPSGKLAYYDGMINLTYTHGDPYNNPDHVPRKTEIAFLCDPMAGKGSPKFLTEALYTYSFKWYTALACPVQPVECVIVDQKSGKEYDLSGLAQSTDNWAVVDNSDPSKVKKFYLNVCRPVNKIHPIGGGTCDAFAAACATDITAGQETMLHTSLGQALKGPTVEEGQTGLLTLTYTNGGSCTLGNGTVSTFTTSIHFTCRKGELSKGPEPPRKLGECEYSFVWETEEACPKAEKTESTGDCQVKDPELDFVYNLSPLTKKGNNFYTAKSSDGTKTYRLNVCGPVPVGTSGCDSLATQKGSPGMCEVQPNRRPSLGESSKKLSLSPTGELTLTYEGARVNLVRSSITITFVCERDASREGPGVVNHESGDYRLEFRTALACPPQPVDCTVQDAKGRQYDLSPLARSDSNWVVTDSRSGHKNLRYFINVCQPLVPVPGTSCPGGAVGGCQVGDNSFNLGYIQSKPSIAADGTISLRYRGGTVCHKGMPNQALRSTRINFRCSAIERSPQFVLETNTCEYVFNWETPSACPVRRVIGSDCKVKDPLYDHEFDLSPLTKSQKDYRVQGNGFEFLLNLCQPLNQGSEACKGSAGVAACQTKPGESFNVIAGMISGQLVYNLGEITLTYSNGKGNCHGKYNRSTVITFVCDHSQEGTAGPSYVKEDFDCTYLFEWRTKYACPPFTVSDCTVVKGNKQYDFSSLARTDDNYETALYSQKEKFFINVCQPVVLKKGVTCPFNAGVCMVNLTETDPAKKFHNLGEVSASPVSVDGQTLKITYSNGEPCQAGKKKTSVLLMTCDPSAIDSEPELPYQVNSCEWHFSWRTALACDASITANTTGANCRTKNPVSGHVFDLTSLQRPEGYRDDDKEGHSYLINVCAPVSGSHNQCSNKKSGSCQNETVGEKRFFNSGVANGNLVYEGGVLTLTYTGGDICHHNNVSRTTVISFYCSQGAGRGSPVYVDKTDGCTYYFSWPTELACEKQVECKVDTGDHLVDLSPLVKPLGHYQVRNMLNDGADYYINVCRPLNPIFGQLCPPGAASCLIKPGQTPKSLGRVTSEPFYEDGKVKLKYDHGEKCEQDPTKNITSMIIFNCRPGSVVGDLQLEVGPTQAACTYVFTWDTSAACGTDQNQAEGASCTFKDTLHDEVYDLSPLKDQKEVTAKDGKKFTLQVCGSASGSAPAPGCQGAAVCRDSSQSFGKAATGHFEMQDDDLSLTFMLGKDCGSGKASTQVVFECDPAAGDGQPRLVDSSDCFAQFHWKTRLVCPRQTATCRLHHGNDNYDLTPLSQASGSWHHKDAKGNEYWINVCQELHGVPLSRGCPAEAAVCQVRHSGTATMLGTVRSQKLSMEGDKGLLLEYSHGVCSGGRRRSEHQQAKTKIHFRCAETVGAPVLTPSSDNEENCIYEFVWKSRLSCKESSQPSVIQEKKHILTDPRTGSTINLDSNGLSAEKQLTDGEYKYHISLVGSVARDNQLTQSHDCDGAAICQTKTSDQTFFLDLGQYSSRKYYVQDDVFEVQYESNQYCSNARKHKIKSIITFECATDGVENSPKLLSNSGNCVYIFHWYTPVACIHSHVGENPAVTEASGGQSKTAESGKGGGVSSKTVGAVVGVFASVAIICIILIIFHKRENCEAFTSQVKRLVLCRKDTEQGIKYSVLSQNEEEILGEGEVGEEGVTATRGGMLLSAATVHEGRMDTLNTYHDDSDDDLLL